MKKRLILAAGASAIIGLVPITLVSAHNGADDSAAQTTQEDRTQNHQEDKQTANQADNDANDVDGAEAQDNDAAHDQNDNDQNDNDQDDNDQDANEANEQGEVEHQNRDQGNTTDTENHRGHDGQADDTDHSGRG